MSERIGIFGAGGFTRQIIDLIPSDALIFTDEGGGELCGFPVLPFDEAPDCDLLIAVADPIVRRRVALQWHNGLGTLIAPSAEVSRFAEIGPGAIICRQAIIEPTAVVGTHFHANLGAKVGHECQIGDFVTLGPGVMICGRCTIGRGATIGAGAVIKQGLTVAPGATVAMGAVVHRDVGEGAMALGNPARIMERKIEAA